MNRVHLSSAMMRSAGYDAATAVLEIEFPGGDVYQYLAVRREDYDGLLRAASKGRFFHSNIRGRFAYRRICNGERG